jgi:hypothetical protein
VRSLAGYVHAASGKVCAAAILIIHHNAGAALAALDATVDWLHRRTGHALTVVDQLRETRPAPAASVDVFPCSPKSRNTR